MRSEQSSSVMSQKRHLLGAGNAVRRLRCGDAADQSGQVAYEALGRAYM